LSVEGMLVNTESGWLLRTSAADGLLQHSILLIVANQSVPPCR
jgi:hypothetical protein